MKQDSERNSDNRPQRDKSKKPTATSTKWWRKIAIAITVLLLGGTGSGLIYGWYFARHKLVPLIETEAGKFLQRPLELGELQGISFTGASFSESALPATEDNPDFVKVNRVKVNLAPLYFLRTRKLKLDIILQQPDVYIEQDASKMWTPTDFASGDNSEGGIQVEVASIQLKGGQLSLVAYNAEKQALNPAVMAEIGRVIIRPLNEVIEFNADAELIRGGKFTLDGEGNSSTGVIDIELVGQQLKAREISNLLALPIEFKQGDIDGKLDITLADSPIPLLNGTLDLDNVSLQIPNLVKPFSGSDGKVHFRGNEIKLDDITSNFGSVAGIASGRLDLAGEGDYQLDTKVKPVAAKKVVDALELESPVPIEGKIKGDIAVRGSLEKPVIGLDVTTTTPSKIDKINFKKIDADLELVDSTLSVQQFTGLAQSGGTVEGNGKVQLDGLQNIAFNIQAKDLSAKAIASSYDSELPVEIGKISGNTNISAQAGDLDTLRFANGEANFALGNGIVEVDNLNYDRGVWTSDVTTSGVEFGSLPFGKGSAEAIAKGTIDGEFEVSGSDVGNLDLVDAAGKADLNTVGGKIAIPQISLADGSWSADLDTRNLRLQRLFPDLPDEFSDRLSGNFSLTGNIPDDDLSQTLINGFGDLDLAEGEVKVEDLQIVDRRWTATAQGSNLKLKQLSSTTPDQFAGLVNGTLDLSGTTDNITPQGIRASGNGSLTLPEGTFNAEQLAIANGRFDAQVIPQVDLSLFADPNSDDLELNGQLGGKLKVTGQVDNLSPTAVSATGDLTFSEGIDLLEQGFKAAVAWDGKRLDVLQATGDNLDARGYIQIDPTFFSDIPDKLAAIDYFEFDVDRANELDITKLRLTLPSWATNLDYSGRSNFTGQIGGVPSAMKIGGNLTLNNFQLEDIAFDPLLAGSVQISPETGVSLQLEEILTEPLFPPAADLDSDVRPPDKIELVLDKNFSPLAFAFAHDYLSVEGTGEREIIEIVTQNIPVKLLKTIALKSDDLELPENIALQPIDGDLSGDFIFNLNTLATSGKNVTIESPALGSIRGDLLKGDFQYIDGYFAVQNAKFRQRNSTYQLEGAVKQQPDDLEIDGRVAIEGGQIQDILVALQIFEIRDFSRIFSDRGYGEAEDLYEPPIPSTRQPIFDIGLKDAPVIEQLQLLSAIQAWLAELQQQRQTAVVPPLKKLKGTFDGEVKVSGSVDEGLDSEFKFLGEQWRWGNLTSKKIVAQGNLEGGILTLVPVSIQLQEATADKSKSSQIGTSPTLVFTGTYGGETQSGQFRLVDIPVELIEQLFSLPSELALGGLINANASIAGTPDNPQARGEIRVDNASLNKTSIESTKGSFNYKNSRLDFSASSLIAKDADPLVLRGSVPYQLPFAKVGSDNDLLELQLNVKDRGLALLDIFSQGELKWIDGTGEIFLDISGVLDPKQNIPRKLVAQGTATIDNATIAAKSLPNNPITNIDSQVFFDLNNISINSFQGDIGGGQILAAGVVPLNTVGSNDPLTIDFDDIFVELPKLYDGGVRGRVQILGKATEPAIAGNVTLFDGTILLANEEDGEVEQTNISTSAQIDAIKRGNTEEGIAATTQYRNLKLELGEDIKISQPPIFTFVATGDLKIDGTFLQPSPDGTITLERGQVNLFTTQLNLSRDYNNTARFSSDNVLDPFLDIALDGSAIETRGRRSVPSEVLPTERPDTDNLGTLETVRVTAKVKGLASQITNRIELTSSPPRSQAEIIALLGGSFVETLGNNTSTLGLATLAGSALFGSLNSEFNNAFPIGELRLFPTQILGDEDNTDDSTSDGIAGELAFDLFDNFSFSVLKILNLNDIPIQYGFRYRLNENFVLRGSSNFRDGEDDGNSRLSIEFESRF